VEWSGERLERELPGRQGRLLFAYLVLNRDRPVRRDELVEALWSEQGPPAGGDALLSPPLSRLRKALGEGRIEGRTELALNLPDDAWIDWEVLGEEVAEARATLGRREWRAAYDHARAGLAIADRGLLPGLEARWIDELRTELASMRLEALEAVAASGARLGSAERAEAERAARAAVEAAPFRESAHAVLIEALRARQNVAEAIRAYERLRLLLRDELGTAPGPTLVALHERLLRAGGEASTAPATADPDGDSTLPDRLAQAAATPFVGRREAIERLRAELRRAEGGETRLVLLTGEGGIGKTRLIAELAAGAESFAVLYGRCDEEELIPFGPWIELLGSYLERVPDAELAVLLGDDGPELSRLLPDLRRRLPELPAPQTGDPDSERYRLFGAVVALISRLAGRGPLLVAIDDLHWADRSSLLLGRQLARASRLGGVMLLGSYRDTELPPGHALGDMLADLERDMPLPRLHIEGMDDDEVGALVAETHRADLPPDVLRTIRAETQGNPFFVKQLVRHMEETGGLATDVPAGVRDVIARRVARLPEHGDQVLRVAALIGRDFDFDVLARVVDVPEDELLDLLDAAVRAGILVEVASAPGRYSFVHALLRTTLEQELSATRRARLHRRIGEAIEAARRDRLDALLVDLARHFLAAGPDEVERAVSYSVRAAEQATGRLAYEEAVDLLEDALAAREADDPVDEEERARLLDLVAGALWRAGRWEDARTEYGRAAEAARAVDAATLFAHVALGHSAGEWDMFGIEDRVSVELLEEAIERLPDEDSALRAQVMARLGRVLYYSPDSELRVPGIVEGAVAMARRVDDPAALVAALAAAQYSLWRPGRAHERLEIANELVELAHSLGGLELSAEAHAWRAFSLLELCRLADADADLRVFSELAEQLQQPQMLVHRLALRSMRALLEGHWEEGERAAAEVFELGERFRAAGRAPTPIHLQDYAVEMIAARNEQNRMDELTPYFERLVRDIGALPGWRTALVWSAVQGGRPDEARAHADELRRDGFSMLPHDANLIPALAVLTHATGELGDAQLAAEIEPLLSPYCEYWVVMGPGPATLGPVAYSVGLLTLVQGKLDEAIAHFETAIEKSLLMRARPYVARSRFGLSQALRRRAANGDRERAETLEQEARTLAEELRMTRLLRELGAVRA
jgi:DNA-binding SARP family transcriptional activator/tetratricopeptide (TPR) repeat protein